MPWGIHRPHVELEMGHIGKTSTYTGNVKMACPITTGSLKTLSDPPLDYEHWVQVTHGPMKPLNFGFATPVNARNRVAKGQVLNGQNG